MHKEILRIMEEQEKLLMRKNEKVSKSNGVFNRYKYPILTAEHVPVMWRYDLNPDTNHYMMERIQMNAVMNAGAIKLNGRYLLVVRVEGADRKSFFAVSESPNGIDNFKFWNYPIQM
jgi:4-O-beta-D-mannosyl-D-glucose phosphorylase